MNTYSMLLWITIFGVVAMSLAYAEPPASAPPASPAPEAPPPPPRPPPPPDVKTEVFKVDWGLEESGLKSDASRSALSGWRFSRGATVKDEGKVTIVEGKGKGKGKALALEPDGEKGLTAYAITTLPPLPVQDLRFSIRREGDEPLFASLYLRTASRKELLRLVIEGGLVRLHGGSQNVGIRVAPDSEGWLEIGIKLDHAAKAATLGVGGEEKGIVLEGWEEEPLTCQFNANFRKLVGRSAVLIDQVSWLKPAN